MNEAEALLELQELCASAKKPQLSDETLGRVLRKWKRPNGSYDFGGAANDAWMRKAALAASLMATSDGGQKFELQQIHEHCLQMAAAHSPAFIC